MTPSSSPDTAQPPAQPADAAFWPAFRFWLKLGFIGFGGPAGQIALMHRELVERRRWISEGRFLHALNFCMVLPGPEAQQLATYLGWLMHRTPGGIAAGVLFVLPAFFILVGLSWLYVAWGQVPWVAGLFYGIKPAVTAIVAQAARRIGGRTLKNRALGAIAAASFIAIFALGLPFPAIVAAAALIGWLGGRLAPELFRTGGGHGPAAAQAAPALIDDDTPTPAHARFTPGRLLRVVLFGGLLWALPMALLGVAAGWDGPLTQMGRFFTQAALLTFGGAYAVLPYVFQGAVAHYGWLSAAQMMDGLALGETTPGPLIMVVTFVGFVGGATHTVLGPDSPFLGGLAAAAVVTWFTFLPSFIFILAGGPLVESTHGKLHLTTPLVAITAAVVGVVASLALFFIAHVALPTLGNGQPGLEIDWIGLFLAATAFVALLRFKLGVIPVLAASALAGLALRLGGWA